MTTATNQTVGSYKIGIMCGIAALLLAGCGSIAETDERPSMVGVISDSPVHMTISADDVRKAKTKGTTILTLPNEKLSLAETHRFRDDGHVDNVVTSGRIANRRNRNITNTITAVIGASRKAQVRKRNS